MATRAARIDTVVRRGHALGIFNGSVLVADNGRVVYEAAFGWADGFKQTPLTPAYRFSIGSVAKEFDAAAVMLLAQDGRLALDDPVARHLPALPAWAEQVRVRDLLRYTSGLPEVRIDAVRSDADALRDLAALTRLGFAPGSGYAYTNNDVFLRRRVVEAAAGLPFTRVVEARLLRPCGMAGAVVDPAPGAPLVAGGFDNDGKADARADPLSGWTHATARDLYAWSGCLAAFRVLTPASTREILTPSGPNRQAGLGDGAMAGGRILRHVHDGSNGSFQALLVARAATRAPAGRRAGGRAEDRTIVLLTNNQHNNLRAFARAIDDILDGRPYQQPKKAILSDHARHLEGMTGADILAFYRELRRTKPDAYGFGDRATLNDVGYWLLWRDRVDDAVTVFTYNTRLFPRSGSVFDSLGEAYLRQGDTTRAVANYRRSLELDPTNDAARRVIAGAEGRRAPRP